MAVVHRDSQPFLFPDSKQSDRRPTNRLAAVGRGMAKGRKLKSDGSNAGDEDDLQELVGEPPEQKNWKGIAIALLVIATICSAIIVAIVSVTREDTGVYYGMNITLDDLFNRSYAPRKIDLQWLKQNAQDYAYLDGYGNLLLRRNGVKGTRETILSSEILISKWADKAWLSPSERYVLLRTKTQRARTYTTLAEYLVYDIQRRYFAQLTTPQTKLLQHAVWAGSNDSLVLVAQNDVYVVPKPGHATVNVSKGGSPSLVYNGVPDPLYEDEILLLGHAVWPDKEGTFVAFASFNDTLLPRHSYMRYSPEDQYNPRVYNQPYPKAGLNSPNPAVSLWFVNVRSDGASGSAFAPTAFKLPDEVTAREHYLTAVTWIAGARLFSSWLSRDFSAAVDCLCSAATGECSVVRRQVARALGELELRGARLAEPAFSSDGSRYFVMSNAKANVEGEHYRHVELVSLDGRSEFITSGPYDDIEVLAVDDAKGLLYFTSTGGDSRDRHLYSVQVDSPEHNRHCLSCGMPGCEYVDAEFNADASLYLLACLGPEVPKYSVWRSDGRDIEGLELNEILRQIVHGLAMPKIVDEEVELQGIDSTGGKQLRAWMRVKRPAHHRPEQIYKYSLVVRMATSDRRHDRGSITKRFSLGWDEFLTSGKQTIVAVVEARGGADNKGLRFASAAYRRPGAAEAVDVARLTRLIASDETLDVYNDSVVFVGEEYSAFVGLHALTLSDNPFACAALTSPITDLRHYYSSFSERLVGLLPDPAAVQTYEAANVSQRMAAFVRARLLLMHGMADDRVHFYNTALLMRVLQGAGTDYSSQIYPDEASDLSISHVSKNYLQTLTSFVHSCISLDG